MEPQQVCLADQNSISSKKAECYDEKRSNGDLQTQGGGPGVVAQEGMEKHTSGAVAAVRHNRGASVLQQRSDGGYKGLHGFYNVHDVCNSPRNLWWYLYAVQTMEIEVLSHAM